MHERTLFIKTHTVGKKLHEGGRLGVEKQTNGKVF